MNVLLLMFFLLKIKINYRDLTNRCIINRKERSPNSYRDTQRTQNLKSV